ncbi:MAG: Uma2 family endonuclease [Thermosynechococcaceae cyanobacterium]
MTLLQVQTPLNTWQSASWEEFVKIADDPASAKLKGYYYSGQMRFEPISTGCDHSKDHVLILVALSFFVANQGISATGYDACSYRRAGFEEFQPDLSYYVGKPADAIPRGIQVVNLEQYPVPSLVIEISDTSFSDDLGMKRLQYETLRIPEYWIVNVQAMKILGFAHASDGSIRHIRESKVLPGLKLEILEQVLQRSREENQSTTNGWLMEQFRS